MLPEPHSPFIGGHNQIELHGSETRTHRSVVGVPPHLGRHAAAPGSLPSDIAAVADKRSKSWLVWVYHVKAQDGGSGGLVLAVIGPSGRRRSVWTGFQSRGGDIGLYVSETQASTNNDVGLDN